MLVKQFGDAATLRTGEVKNEVVRRSQKQQGSDPEDYNPEDFLARSPLRWDISNNETAALGGPGGVGVHVSACGAYSQASGPWIQPPAETLDGTSHWLTTVG